MNSILIKLSLIIIGTTLCFQSIAAQPIRSETSQAEKTVVDFYNQIFSERGNAREIADRYLHEDYIQHNPYVANGREAFINAIGQFVKSAPATRNWVIKRVIASGDYVVVHVHSYDTAKKAPGSAGIDIFRVENGKIKEHWDVWQDIPEKMPHENGMI